MAEKSRVRRVTFVLMLALLMVGGALTWIAVKWPRQSLREIPDEKNAGVLWQKITHPSNDLETRIEMMAQVFEMEGWQLPPEWKRLQLVRPFNFLDAQVWAKVARVVAVFRMIEGKRDEALRIAASTFRMGQLMKSSQALVIRLVGTACQSIAGSALEVYALNACETEAEIRQLWDMLDRLERSENRYTVDVVRDGESTLFDWWPPWRFRLTRDRFEKAVTYMDLSTAKFELLRMAAAARYCLIATGELPAGPNELGPLLPSGPPTDPFSGKPLLSRRTSDSLLCWSVGPDARDGSAATVYDPTNGTISPGDVLLQVPRERRYPFPRQGVRADGLEDLLRQFPNGFPADPFATNRGRGLSAAESADGRVYVWSFGPDVDEYKTPNPLTFFPVPTTGTFLFPSVISVPYGPPPPHRLQVPYDPTNGTVSEGDLFIPIPRKAKDEGPKGNGQRKTDN